MRIAIEATLAQGRPTGMGQYVMHLLQEFSEIAGDKHEFILLHSNKKWTGLDYGPQFTPVSYHFLKPSLAIYFRLNSILKKYNVDLFHATGTSGAPPHAFVPVVSTIHDIYPLNHPEECSKSQALCFQRLLTLALKGSRHIITVSSFIAEELTSSVGVPAEKITTIPLAPCIVEDVAESVQRGPGNFFLCVSAIDPRKGQMDLLEGYIQAFHRNTELPNLKFVGPDRGRAEALCSRISDMKLENKVEWESFIDDKILKRRFSDATAFIFPSTYEGFGIPLLEAICYGKPILCSDIPVFREVGGEYPIYVKPEPQAWTKAITAFNSGEYDSHFSQVTPARILNRYSWRKCAKETLLCYQMVAEEQNSAI